MDELLNDTENYAMLQSDPTQSLEAKNNRLINTLHNKLHQYITSEQAKQLKTYTAIPPRIFGKMKIHKPDRKMRPVVSTINAPCYKLARFLSKILRDAFQSKYALKNSGQLVKQIIQKTIPDNFQIVSFDVENCFTNISTDLALRIIERDFDGHISKQTNIPKKQFMNLLRFCLIDCNYFSYKNKIITMKRGLFMGSSLAPILVERVLDDAIDTMMGKLDFEPLFWYSYVDDHVTAIPTNKIAMVLDALHSYDPNLKFTYETEVDRKLDYLDISLNRLADGKVITNWYHKPIASNRLLNFYSNHPMRMKINIVKSFVRKIFRVSHKTFWKENLKRIHNILGKNNYPKTMIDKIICTVQRTRRNYNHTSYAFMSFDQTATLESTKIQERKKYSSLVYVPNLSDTITRSCKHFIPDVQLAMRPQNKNSNMFSNLKSEIPKENKSSVVYKIDCEDCEATYIGETIQKLGTRKRQHMNDTKKQSNSNNLSALAKHAIKNKHNFKFDEMKILVNERNKTKLQIHEVNQIIKFERNACNDKTDKKDYSNTYYNLIKMGFE